MVHGKQLFGPCNGSKIIGQKKFENLSKVFIKKFIQKSSEKLSKLTSKNSSKYSVKKSVKPKGQLIWKAFFGILEFLQKTNEQIHS